MQGRYWATNRLRRSKSPKRGPQPRRRRCRKIRSTSCNRTPSSRLLFGLRETARHDSGSSITLRICTRLEEQLRTVAYLREQSSESRSFSMSPCRGLSQIRKAAARSSFTRMRQGTLSVGVSLTAREKPRCKDGSTVRPNAPTAQIFWSRASDKRPAMSTFSFLGNQRSNA